MVTMNKRKRPNRIRCGECDGCRSEDCGNCKNCVRKKKHGGDGSSKDACVHRQCTDMKERPGSLSPSNKDSAAGGGDTPRQRKSSSELKARARSKVPKPQKSPILRRIPTHMYGNPLTGPVKDVCAGCLGARDDELQNEPILLCDGKGCSSEYHLDCCLPPLLEVPEGTYYCMDCDPEGTTSQLHEYFEQGAARRADFPSSLAYVQSILEEEMASAETTLIPISELERITETHSCALQSKDTSSHTEREPLGPDFLVGKPIRLYCPRGNLYHNGRILDWRIATHLAPITSGDSISDDFHGTTEIAKCEFLVTFPGGMDYRKETLHQWIILEEHCLAVGVSLVWGKMHPRKSVMGWRPAQTWLRTSAELVSVAHLLSESLNQVRFMDSPNPPPPQEKTWALAKFLGGEIHSLLLLSDEAIDFFSPTFARQRSVRLSHLKKEDPDKQECDVAMALAYAEAEEQRRIRSWCSMPLENPVHHRALTIADEGTLPPVEILPEHDESEPTVVDFGPKPCQLMPQGLDRMYLMELMKSQGVEWSKDTAASISCRRVGSPAAAIEKLCKMRSGLDLA